MNLATWFRAASGTFLVLCGLFLQSCSTAERAPKTGPESAPAILIGAGDIADCGTELTAAAAAASMAARAGDLLDAFPDATVFTTGDNAYLNGTAAQFADCYDRTWGRARKRTRPALGNHDYGLYAPVRRLNADPYFDYFGASAGPRGKGYYSYDLGDWHIVALNSSEDPKTEQAFVSQEQLDWLKVDLAAHPRLCTLAYWHHPLFTSGIHRGDAANMEPVWELLQEAGVDVVLNGHDHHYEVFDPQDARGNPDPARGIREFVVGTGGRYLRKPDEKNPAQNSKVRNGETFGVLKLTLFRERYEWEFLRAEGATFRDQDRAACH